MTSLLVALVLQSPAHPGFSHNDYEHPRPLMDAWEQGFQFAEADVFLVNGKILVAHDRKDVREDRTLTTLYLEPLSKLSARGEKPFWLMVDIKADGAAVYAALQTELEKYQSILVKWNDKGPSKGRVAIVLSGDRPVNLVAGQKDRWVAIDGRPEDLTSKPPVGLVPWISTSYLGFKWPSGMKGYVDLAHEQGRKVRFWAIPDSATSWKMQLEQWVDMINTDKPKEFADWFKSVKPKVGGVRSLSQ